MLLPDEIHPELTVYYNGQYVLKTLQENRSIKLLDLYAQSSAKKSMTMQVFVLCLDWLYLLGVAEFRAEGEIVLCS